MSVRWIYPSCTPDGLWPLIVIREEESEEQGTCEEFSRRTEAYQSEFKKIYAQARRWSRGTILTWRMPTPMTPIPQVSPEESAK